MEILFSLGWRRGREKEAFHWACIFWTRQKLSSIVFILMVFE